MRTSDTSMRTVEIHNNNTFHNAQPANINSTEGENNNINNKKEDENPNIFDNFSLCQKYGQANIEKTILLLIIILLLTGFILYYYWNLLRLYYIRLLLISASIDIILLLFNCALRLKFNSNDWFNSFPTSLYNFIDYIILINSLILLYLFISQFNNLILY